MAEPAIPTNLGFLTVLTDPAGCLGGYLVTNTFGRPLEFRLSTAVQPNRVQQILYGPTLDPYIHAEVIGKTLFEKTTTPAGLIFTDQKTILDLRRQINVPMVFLHGFSAETEDQNEGSGRPVNSWTWHPEFSEDREKTGAFLGQLRERLDLAEPFSRIRDAIAEARKMGVTNRG